MENPKIRFKGFTKDWEQRKLSDVLDIVTKRNGEKYGKEEVLSVSDEYGCINQIKFQGRSFAGEDISNYKIVDTGDIIYTRSPLKSKPYGIIKVVGDEIGIVSPLYIVNKVKEGNNSQFIYRVFDSPEKTNKYLSPLVRKGAKNTMNISNDEWLSGKIDVAPSYEEQYQIGLYFDHLDNLITLHQRKCEQTKNLKKYMLQKMFPQNGAKVPEIRFNGFTHDWEQRKFSDIASRESVSRESSYDLPSLEYEDVIAEEGRLNKDISLKENIKKGIVFDGSQVLYGKLRPYLHNWLNPDFSGVAVGDWWVLKPNNADKSFIYRLIQTQRFDDIANQSAGSKMPRADWNLVSNTEFAVPVSQEEQEKIGEYFSSLDHLITLHQRQCDELKKMKKYMLQNMFI
jgi:type I restriction enzyme S subunit